MVERDKMEDTIKIFSDAPTVTPTAASPMIMGRQWRHSTDFPARISTKNT
jgi:hypothetical protein